MQNTEQFDETVEKFSQILKKLAHEGCIESLSIEINSSDGDELFKMAQILGIKKLSITAKYYC